MLIRANEAKDKTIEAGAKEKVQMEVAGSFDNSGNFDIDILKNNLKKNLKLPDSSIVDNGDGTLKVIIDENEVIVNLDRNVLDVTITPPTESVKQDTIFRDINSSNKEALIPKGFKVSGEASEQKIDSGLVLIAPDDSEFVWVPVNRVTLCVDNITGKEIAEIVKEEDYRGILYNFSETESSKMLYSDNDYREPAFLTDSTYGDTSEFNTIGITEQILQQEYNNIIKKIKQNGGFYVGRYESSLSDSTKTIAATTGNIQSKKEIMPTSASNTGTKMWYGLYAKQKEYAEKINTKYNTKINSTMIYGSMYDAIMNWALYGTDQIDRNKISASSTMHGPEFTGAQIDDKIKNIFDLGNNLREWTVEGRYTSDRVYRGRRLWKYKFSSFSK